MDTQNQTPSHQGVAGIIGGLVQHAQTWGKVWFGLIFWGCVLYAVSQRIWPETNNALLLVISLILGLSSGIYAHIRGYWL